MPFILQFGFHGPKKIKFVVKFFTTKFGNVKNWNN